MQPLTHVFAEEENHRWISAWIPDNIFTNKAVSSSLRQLLLMKNAFQTMIYVKATGTFFH